jgi:hypothetical protein
MHVPISKSGFWLIFLSLLGVAVVTVMATLAYLLLTLPGPAGQTQATASPSRPALSLPTAPLPTATPGPPPAGKAIFIPQKPIIGFSDCDSYGFKGIVTASNGDRLAGVQVIIWQEGVGLLTVGNTDIGGSYFIEVKDKPAQRKLWVQVYQNDVPASEPISVETQADCRTGHQIYQINWQEK